MGYGLWVMGYGKIMFKLYETDILAGNFVQIIVSKVVVHNRFSIQSRLRVIMT